MHRLITPSSQVLPLRALASAARKADLSHPQTPVSPVCPNHYARCTLKLLSMVQPARFFTTSCSHHPPARPQSRPAHTCASHVPDQGAKIQRRALLPLPAAGLACLLAGQSPALAREAARDGEVRQPASLCMPLLQASKGSSGHAPGLRSLSLLPTDSCRRPPAGEAL
jgi:hypothetical protein